MIYICKITLYCYLKHTNDKGERVHGISITVREELKLSQVQEQDIKKKLKDMALLSSFKTIDNESDVILVEKCYVLVGIKPDHESLMFNGLQQLVDLEKDVSQL